MSSETIKRELSILVGLSTRYIGRAANIAWLGFGSDVVIKTHKGEERVLAKYALHLQTTFRVLSLEKVLFGSYDMYEPNTKTKWTEDFQWDVQGANYYDEHANELTMELERGEILVTKIDATSYGDLTITLSNELVLEVYVDRGKESECWRFFEPGSENKHFVVTGQGLEKH